MKELTANQNLINLDKMTKELFGSTYLKNNNVLYDFILFQISESKVEILRKHCI